MRRVVKAFLAALWLVSLAGGAQAEDVIDIRQPGSHVRGNPLAIQFCFPELVDPMAHFTCKLVLSPGKNIPEAPIVRLGNLLEYSSQAALHDKDRVWAAYLMRLWEDNLPMPKNDGSRFGERMSLALTKRLDACASQVRGACTFPREQIGLLITSIIMAQRLYPRDRELWWWFAKQGL